MVIDTVKTFFNAIKLHIRVGMKTNTINRVKCSTERKKSVRSVPYVHYGAVTKGVVAYFKTSTSLNTNDRDYHRVHG